MHKYFVLLGAEVLAGAIGFFLVIAAIVVVSHDVGEFLFDLKTRLIGLALIMPFIKLISGYYLILWGYLRLTHQNMSNFFRSSVSRCFCYCTDVGLDSNGSRFYSL